MKNKKRIILIISGVIAAVVLFAGLFIYIFTMVFRNMQNIEAYTFGSDSVASVNSVVGKRAVNSYQTTKNTEYSDKTIQYISDSVQEDLRQYSEYLVGEGGFETEFFGDAMAEGRMVFYKESADSGKILIMTIDYTDKGYQINIRKGKESPGRRQDV